MLEHAAVSSHTRQRRREAPAVIAALVAPAGLHQAGKPTPPRARRVRYDRMRSRVEASVARFIPRVYVGVSVVGASCLDVERRDRVCHAPQGSLAARQYASAFSRAGKSPMFSRAGKLFSAFFAKAVAPTRGAIRMGDVGSRERPRGDTQMSSQYSTYAANNVHVIKHRWALGNNAGNGMGWGQESHTLAEAAADMGAIVLPGAFDGGGLLCELSDRLYLLRDVNGPWAVEVAIPYDLPSDLMSDECELGTVTANVNAPQTNLVQARQSQGRLDPTGSLARMLSGRPDNPYLDQQASAITNQLTRNLNENVMPGVRSEALASGQYGGSRQGIAEGLAASRLNQDLAPALTNLYGGAYENAQGRMYGTANSLNDQAFQNATNNANRDFAGQQFNVSNDLAKQQFNANLGLQNNSQLMQKQSQNLGNRMQGIGILGGANAIQDNNFAQYMNAQGAPNQYNWQNLNNYAGIIQPGAGMGSTQSQTMNKNIGAGVLGGGLAGAGAYFRKFGGLNTPRWSYSHPDSLKVREMIPCEEGHGNMTLNWRD